MRAAIESRLPSCVLAFLIVGCGDDDSTVQPPTSVPDAAADQVVDVAPEATPDVGEVPDVYTDADAAVDGDVDATADGDVDATADGDVDAADADASTGSGIGEPCDASGSGPKQGTCNDGLICMRDSAGFPDGYCTRSCETSACPIDATCIPGDLMDMCFRSCSASSECRVPDYDCMIALRACMPGASQGPPIGTDNGEACVDPTGIDLAADSRFGDNRNISGSTSAYDSEVSIAAGTKGIATAFISEHHIGIASSADGITFTRQADIVDVVTTDQCDPGLAVDTNGDFVLVWLGLDRTPSGDAVNRHIFVARSADGGATWTNQVDATDPRDLSPTQIDKPWIAIAPDGTIYTTYMAYNSGLTSNIQLVRSFDAGATWSPATTVNTGSFAFGNLAQPIVTPSGEVCVVWVDVDENPYGDIDSAIQMSCSSDSGETFGPTVRVSGVGEKIVFDVPVPAVDQDNIYVTYVAGEPTGAWDVRVAKAPLSTKVFDASVLVSPGPSCPTRFHPWSIVDEVGRLHVVWYDNSYLFGVVRHAQVEDPRTDLVFSSPSYVTDAEFPFTTRRDVYSWLGDYIGLIAYNGTLHTVWADPREGGYSHIYHASGPTAGP